MPPIFAFRCNKCGFDFPPGWGGRFYIIDHDGKRVMPGHPGEFRAVDAILGKNPPPGMREARTGFNSDCLCLDCLHQFQMDTKWDERVCPECNSVEIMTTRELIGKNCPRCKEGIIVEIDTGFIT
jgi:DNA-directed RNA polymerase subunit RPC12/RpoP